MDIQMTLQDLQGFFSAWKNANAIYQNLCPGNHLHFPEPLQKEIVMLFYDKTLKQSTSGPYDFENNIELKSSTKFGGGCTPFKSSQNNCSRIIYLEIGDHINVYELSSLDVKTINSLISKNVLEITLSYYTKNVKPKQII